MTPTMGVKRRGFFAGRRVCFFFSLTFCLSLIGTTHEKTDLRFQRNFTCQRGHAKPPLTYVLAYCEVRTCRSPRTLARAVHGLLGRAPIAMTALCQVDPVCSSRPLLSTIDSHTRSESDFTRQQDSRSVRSIAWRRSQPEPTPMPTLLRHGLQTHSCVYGLLCKERSLISNRTTSLRNLDRLKKWSTYLNIPISRPLVSSSTFIRRRWQTLTRRTPTISEGDIG